MKIGISLILILGISTTLAAASLSLASPAFEPGQPIPPKYSRQGGNVSPPLAFGNVPPATRSLAVLLTDPDSPSGAWTHWLVANLPPAARDLESGKLPEGAAVGANSWGAARYDGPQPPLGLHHYVFHLYALDSQLDLQPGFTQKEFAGAAKGHILASAQLTGAFAK